MMRFLFSVLFLACLGVRPGISQSTAGSTIDATTGKASTTPAGGTTAGSTNAIGSTMTGTNASTEMTTNSTEPTMMTTITTENSTDNITSEPTTMGATTLPLTTALPTGTYRVNDTDGQTCILMQFYLLLDITYNTTSGTEATVGVVFPANSDYSGNCTKDSRSFTLTYPEYEDWYLNLNFLTKGQMYEMTSVTFHWKYEDHFFNNPDQMGETGKVVIDNPKSLNVRAETGKTFACKTRELSAEKVNITLKDIKFQPYADDSDDKGNFGKLEVCSEDRPTNKPGTTQASADNTGMIVGIVIGSLVGVALILGGVYFFMRHRHKGDSYKSLD